MLGLTAVLRGDLRHPHVRCAGVRAARSSAAARSARSTGSIVWNVATSPLIITLGMLTLLRGVVYIVTNGQAITGMPNSFANFGNSEAARARRRPSG